MISGGLAGIFASFIITPFERVKILFQTNQANWNYINKNFNVKFLSQGLVPTLCRDPLGYAIYFSTYNFLKNKKSTPINLFESFCYGAISGSTAWLFIYPQDRIKTHVQAITNRNISFISGCKEVIFIGGYRELYKGFSYSLMRAIPLHATVFMSMEFCKKYL